MRQSFPGQFFITLSPLPYPPLHYNEQDANIRKRRFMKTSRVVTCVLSFLTGGGILLLWVFIWSGKFPIDESVPGFRNYFLSFQAADLWLILLAFLTGIFIILRNPKALLFGIALGSSMVFFGLYSLLYDLNTGLFFNFSASELFGKCVTFYNILAGLLFIFLSWKDRQMDR